MLIGIVYDTLSATRSSMCNGGTYTEKERMDLVPEHGGEDIWKEDIARDGEDGKDDKEEHVKHDNDGGDDAKYVVCQFPR